ncbi:hypothetical protein CTA2_7995, partial [Colletotrichum tanaceti]
MSDLVGDAVFLVQVVRTLDPGSHLFPVPLAKVVERRRGGAGVGHGHRGRVLVEVGRRAEGGLLLLHRRALGRGWRARRRRRRRLARRPTQLCEPVLQLAHLSARRREGTVPRRWWRRAAGVGAGRGLRRGFSDSQSRHRHARRSQPVHRVLVQIAAGCCCWRGRRCRCDGRCGRR